MYNIQVFIIIKQLFFSEINRYYFKFKDIAIPNSYSRKYTGRFFFDQKMIQTAMAILFNQHLSKCALIQINSCYRDNSNKNFVEPKNTRPSSITRDKFLYAEMHIDIWNRIHVVIKSSDTIEIFKKNPYQKPTAEKKPPLKWYKL